MSEKEVENNNRIKTLAKEIAIELAKEGDSIEEIKMRQIAKEEAEKVLQSYDFVYRFFKKKKCKSITQKKEYLEEGLFRFVTNQFILYVVHMEKKWSVVKIAKEL